MPPAPEQTKPDATEILAQAEAQKAQNQAQKAIIDAETDRMKIIMDDDRHRDETEAQIRLKAAELLAKYGTQVNIAEINAIMERDRETIRQTAKDQAQGLFTGNVPKIFDIEVMEGEIVYRGSEIKARNKDHALQIMILMSGGQVNENSEIISFEEKTLH